MIAALKGLVAEKNLSDAVIDVNGVGYRVNLSLITMACADSFSPMTSYSRASYSAL